MSLLFSRYFRGITVTCIFAHSACIIYSHALENLKNRAPNYVRAPAAENPHARRQLVIELCSQLLVYCLVRMRPIVTKDKMLRRDWKMVTRVILFHLFLSSSFFSLFTGNTIRQKPGPWVLGLGGGWLEIFKFKFPTVVADIH